ncbi:MAG: hypothetical protein PUC47_08480 [Oscillospiraceae bacterium]|nr:hypothetical protein [Oscillospiraceae bacterium]
MQMRKRVNIRWQLVLYDMGILAAVDLLLLVFSGSRLSAGGVAAQFAIAGVCIFVVRLLGNVYGQIWRYGGIQCYIRLVMVDAAAFLLTILVERSLPVEHMASPTALCCPGEQRTCWWPGGASARTGRSWAPCG